MESLKFHRKPPYPTLLRPAGRPPLKQPHGRFRGGPPAERATSHLHIPRRTPMIANVHRAKVGEGKRLEVGRRIEKGLLGEKTGAYFEGKMDSLNYREGLP
jgi:hypothetical protein